MGSRTGLLHGSRLGLPVGFMSFLLQAAGSFLRSRLKKLSFKLYRAKSPEHLRLANVWSEAVFFLDVFF